MVSMTERRILSSIQEEFIYIEKKLPKEKGQMTGVDYASCLKSGILSSCDYTWVLGSWTVSPPPFLSKIPFQYLQSINFLFWQFPKQEKNQKSSIIFTCWQMALMFGLIECSQILLSTFNLLLATVLFLGYCKYLEKKAAFQQPFK